MNNKEPRTFPDTVTFINALQALAPPVPGMAKSQPGSAMAAYTFFGVSKQTWASYRNGTGSPSLDRAREWAAMVGIRVLTADKA